MAVSPRTAEALAVVAALVRQAAVALHHRAGEVLVLPMVAALVRRAAAQHHRVVEVLVLQVAEALVPQAAVARADQVATDPRAEEDDEHRGMVMDSPTLWPLSWKRCARLLHRA